MFARIEVALRPEFNDPIANDYLRRIELLYPELRKKIRWARWIDVYWLDVPFSREELISSATEIFWDPVLQWMFTGNLIPSAAGKQGGLQDLMELAPFRPGRFWAIEKRFRPGITDDVARSVSEAFDIVLRRQNKNKTSGFRASHGAIFLLEGVHLAEAELAQIAREFLCNHLLETWTLFNEEEVSNSDRFHQDRMKLDLPKPISKPIVKNEIISLKQGKLAELSKKRNWGFGEAEWKKIVAYFENESVRNSRLENQMPENPTDVELAMIAQAWSEHCRHRVFNSEVEYEEKGDLSPEPKIPQVIPNLFNETIRKTTEQLPKNWILSAIDDNAGILAFDDEDAFCIKVETHNTPAALDPFAGASIGLEAVQRDILGAGIGAKPIFLMNSVCLPAPSWSGTLPSQVKHPRNSLEGIVRGLQEVGNKSGVPMVNGSFYFDQSYLAKPLLFVGAGGWMPRNINEKKCEVKEIYPGDYLVMVGGRVGKDGIQGATVSSMAFNESTPSATIQRADPILQKRIFEFILEVRDLSLYRSITDCGAGGIAGVASELALKTGGIRLDISKIPLKVETLKSFEILLSESQERMILVVPPQDLEELIQLGNKRGVECSEIGIFTEKGLVEVFDQQQPIARINLNFIHEGLPHLKLNATWKGRPQFPEALPEGVQLYYFESQSPEILLQMLGRPVIASKEKLIRRFDHEVQGASVIKPFQISAVGTSQLKLSPNNSGVIKPKLDSLSGIVISCGMKPSYYQYDPFLMAEASVDEAIRNYLCSGGEYGTPESVVAIVDNFCWPNPTRHTDLMGGLVRAAYGLREAALQLGTPIVSGKDSMSNNYEGYVNHSSSGSSYEEVENELKFDTQSNWVELAVTPTLLITAVGKVADIRNCRSSDFKTPGDVIYLLGGKDLGVVGSELERWFKENEQEKLPSLRQSGPRIAKANWQEAQKIYAWLGGSIGREQLRMKSLHDVSEGGVCVAVSESLFARGLGATLVVPNQWDPWEFCFGEGFHSFVLSVQESDTQNIEMEWKSLGVPFVRIGMVTHSAQMEVHTTLMGMQCQWKVPTEKLYESWIKEGYWE